MDAEELRARQGILDTLARYNFAGDRGRLDELAACFCEDGVLVVEGDWSARGREEIQSRLASVVSNSSGEQAGRTLRHHLTTHRAEFESQTVARSWTYFLVLTERGPDHAGRYVDRLHRCDGTWLLAHRRVVLEWEGPEGRFRVDGGHLVRAGGGP